MEDWNDALERADVLRDQGRNDLAEEAYASLIRSCISSPCLIPEFEAAYCYHMRAVSLRTMGALNTTMAFATAERAYTVLGDSKGSGNVLRDWALDRFRQGETKLAIKVFNDSLKQLRKCDDKSGVGITLAKKGIVYMAMRRLSQANECLDTSIQLLNVKENPFQWGTAMMHRGELFIAQRLFMPAYEYLTSALEVFHPEERYVYRNVELLGLFAMCDVHRGHGPQAGRKILHAMALMHENKWPPQQMQMMLERIRITEIDNLVRKS